MNRNVLLPLVIISVLISTVSYLPALPIGDSNKGIDYAFSDRDLSHWCSGIYYKTIKNSIDYFGSESRMESARIMAYIGYSPIRWLMPYVTAGQNEIKIRNIGSSDSTFEYGVGVHINIFDHELLDPGTVEDRIRITGTCQYTLVAPEFGAQTLEWTELYACLKASIVNDLTGNVLFFPGSIAFFIGPVYMNISGDINSIDNMGVTAGIDIYYSEKITLSLGMDRIGSDDGIFLGLHSMF